MTMHSTTHDSTQSPVPPGERDFEVYRLVTIEQKSTRTAAKITGISQTRVCQIVQRVADYLIETAPDSEEHPRKQKQLNAARQAAAEQISYLGEQAMRSFRKSLGPKTTVRQVSKGSDQTVTITTIRESEGDCRYLFAGARLALMGAKLPLAGLLPTPREAGGEVREAREEIKIANDENKNPSKEECSVKASEQGVTSTIGAQKKVASVPRINTFEKSKAPQDERKVAQRETVHPAPGAKSISPRKQFTREHFLDQMPPELSPRAQAALNLE